jgi:hypothetical protein
MVGQFDKNSRLTIFEVIQDLFFFYLGESDKIIDKPIPVMQFAPQRHQQSALSMKTLADLGYDVDYLKLSLLFFSFYCRAVYLGESDKIIDKPFSINSIILK